MRIKQVNLITQGVFKRSLIDKLRYFNKHNRHMVRLLAAVIALFLLSIIVPALSVSVYRYRITGLKNKIAGTKLKFKKLQSQDFQLEKIKAELKTEESRLAGILEVLSSTMGPEGGYVPRLAAISESVPKDLWMNGIIMDAKGVQISGTALDSRLIVGFMDKLNACRYFKEVRFVSSEKQIADSHAVYNFQISVEYAGPGQDGAAAAKAAGSRE